MKNHVLNSKIIGFVGDSVTFGYDDDTPGKQLIKPWPDEVGEMLSCTTINMGVSSASLLKLDSWTPIAWSHKVNLIPRKIDILGFMIGINDCFRSYPVGKMGDKEASTFYGGLYTLIRCLQDRFPAKDGKRIFMIMYPNYDAKEDFKEYAKAMNKTAHYFSVPVCDLSKLIGASPYNDSQYTYWRKCSSNNFHSSHPTQITSHLIAESISNFISSHYKIG